MSFKDFINEVQSVAPQTKCGSTIADGIGMLGAEVEEISGDESKGHEDGDSGISDDRITGGDGEQ